MKQGIFTFLICFAVAFGAGYLFYDSQSVAGEQIVDQQTDPGDTPVNVDANQAGATATSGEGEIFNRLGCISCHAVSALNVKGGTTGPDLSKAYAEVKGKHGVSIEEFLRKPTSAVMSSVIGAKPLTDEEIKSVVAALQAAAEAKQSE